MGELITCEFSLSLDAVAGIWLLMVSLLRTTRRISLPKDNNGDAINFQVGLNEKHPAHSLSIKNGGGVLKRMMLLRWRDPAPL
jgi:hypothetical protein